MFQVKAALEGPEAKIGELIAQHGMEDSSGLRRMLIFDLRSKNPAPFIRLFGMDHSEFDKLRQVFVDAYGEPG